MSAGKVDVLAVLKDVVRYETKTGSPEWVAELRETRAAVAELILAADALLTATGRSFANWPLLSDKRVAWRRVDVALRAAVAADPHNGLTSEAIRAALAKVQP